MPDMVVLEEKKFYQKARFWRWVVFISFVIFCLVAFSPEMRSLLAFLLDVLNRTEHFSAILERRDFQVLVVNLLAFIAFFVAGLLLTAQFILPVQTLQERRKAADRILRYLMRRHGPAVFVKEAQVIGQAEELESSYPGVVFVDLCSTIALENQFVPVSPTGAPDPGQTTAKRPKRIRRLNIFQRGRMRQEKPVRVAGPGIVFTEWGEKLRGVADLRRQFRLIPNVSFGTRDGFSVLSHVFIIFSLGEKPDVLKVAIQGDTPADVRSVKVDERTKRVTGFTDELDDADKAEIFHFIKSYRPETVEEIWPDESGPPPAKAPYVYDPERVFAAIYAESRNAADQSSERWSDLPPRVAIEVFRDMLSLEKFNDLYRPDQPYEEGKAETFPFLDIFRNEFSQKVRNQGVLAFQAGKRRDGKQLQVGDRWDVDWLEIMPERKLRNSKVLRNRGIRVVVSGFPELNPSHPGVRQQLVEYWSARWKRDASQTEAEHNLEAMRMQTRARAEAQRDMVDVLRRIYSLPELSQEAMSIRLFQALEGAAAEPRTRQLMPGDSLTFLWDLRQYLLPTPREDG
jgi:hypothetical protein